MCHLTRNGNVAVHFLLLISVNHKMAVLKGVSSVRTNCMFIAQSTMGHLTKRLYQKKGPIGPFEKFPGNASPEGFDLAPDISYCYGSSWVFLQI